VELENGRSARRVIRNVDAALDLHDLDAKGRPVGFPSIFTPAINAGDDQRDEATFVSLAPDWINELAIGLHLLEEPACNSLSIDMVQNVGQANKAISAPLWQAYSRQRSPALRFRRRRCE